MLVGFKAKNHPQQIRGLGGNDRVDDRALPAADFSALQARFQFTVDAAAAPHNAKLPKFWTRRNSGLTQPWGGGSGLLQSALQQRAAVGREGLERDELCADRAASAGEPDGANFLARFNRASPRSSGLAAARRVPPRPAEIFEARPKGREAQRTAALWLLPVHMGSHCRADRSR